MINIRKIKESDLDSLRVCVNQKIIPVAPFLGDYSTEDLLDAYLQYDYKLCFVYAIVDMDDNFLGAIDALLVDTSLLVSYYIMPSMQRKGVCTQGMQKFISLITKDFKHIRKLKCEINNLNSKSIRVVKKLSFSLKRKNAEVQTWELSLRTRKKPL